MLNIQLKIQPKYPQFTPPICRVNGKRYRYGFNGKEKDNETYGEGNAYDFGARIYDSRLGRWLSLDNAIKNYPSWTPYRFGKCSPINYSDPNGDFEIDEKTAAAYPKLDAMLKNISATYTGKPEAFRQAFKQYSEMSDDQISKMLEYKRVPNETPVLPNQPNPRIKVEEMVDLGVTEFEYKGQNENGEYLNTSTNGTIVLQKSMVDNYERLMTLKAAPNTNAFDKNVELEASILTLEGTIFHEGTHYGDLLNGISSQTTAPTEKNPNLKTKEGGDAFEVKAYGTPINGNNEIIHVINNNLNMSVTKDKIANIKNKNNKQQDNLTPSN